MGPGGAVAGGGQLLARRYADGARANANNWHWNKVSNALMTA